MMIYMYAKDDTAIHRQITEALMAVKEDLVKVRHLGDSSRRNLFLPARKACSG